MMAARWGWPQRAEGRLRSQGLRRIGTAIGRVASPLEAFDRAFSRVTQKYVTAGRSPRPPRKGRRPGARAVRGVGRVRFGSTGALPDGSGRSGSGSSSRAARRSRTSREAARLEQIFLADPEVEAVFTRRAAGRAGGSRRREVCTAVLECAVGAGQDGRVLARSTPTGRVPARHAGDQTGTRRRSGPSSA